MRRRDADYRSYAELASAQVEGMDYHVRMQRRAESAVAIVAPHGGGIEAGTSEVARALAGTDFNLYLFEGIRPSGNYAALHLTSHRFDEPRCLAMLSDCERVVAIHGCSGESPQALLGGLDTELKEMICQAIGAAGIDARPDGHRFPALDPQNVCNRGRRGIGVQIELSDPLRLQQVNRAMVDAIRSVLLAL